MNTFRAFFGWPGGGVWANLLASGVCLGAGWLWARRQLLRELERREVAHFRRHAETYQLVQGLHARLDVMQSGTDHACMTEEPLEGVADDHLRP